MNIESRDLYEREGDGSDLNAGELRGWIVTSGLFLEPVSWLVLACMIKLEQYQHNSPRMLIPFRRSQSLQPAPGLPLASSLETHSLPLSLYPLRPSRSPFLPPFIVADSVSPRACNLTAIRNFTAGVRACQDDNATSATSS